MKRLSGEHIKALHKLLIAETGGMNGMRDEGLFESAIQSPFQTFSGEYLYKSIEMKAARLCYSLIKNHPFVDGNKRIGVLVMLTFLELNGITFACTDDDLIKIGLEIAEGSMDDAALMDWIMRKET
jgi:death-on-curing protein